jgi:NAD(P)-dependent dehydrogenase (short-subunit alcohol dehydrogenase family)
MDFTDKAVVITGGAGVIGLATARAFLARGARIMLVDADEERLRSALSGLGTSRVNSCVADVTKPEDVKRYAEASRAALGKVDVFFNNAGIEGPVDNLVDYDDAAFDRVMEVNVRGVFLGCKYVAPHMPAGGSIIITSSTAGLHGSPLAVGYATSKWAVRGIARTAAMDLALRGIRCNTVHPGMVEGDMMRRLEIAYDRGGTEGSLRQALIERTPLGRYIEPSEVTNVVLFLASDYAAGITGAEYVVDAGFMA